MLVNIVLFGKKAKIMDTNIFVPIRYTNNFIESFRIANTKEEVEKILKLYSLSKSVNLDEYDDEIDKDNEFDLISYLNMFMNDSLTFFVKNIDANKIGLRADYNTYKLLSKGDSYIFEYIRGALIDHQYLNK